VIEDHGQLECPPDDAVLWRFMDFTKFLDLLETGYLWFSHLNKMDDKYEGALTKPVVERIRVIQRGIEEAGGANANPHLAQYLSRQMRDSCCVSCWHMNPHESAAMWKQYLKSDEGVAVRTTFAEMKRAFAETPDLIFPAVVKYLDYATEDYPLHNGFFCVVHKRKSFEHESEVRLVWWCTADQNARLPDVPARGPGGEYLLPGRAINVDVPALVQQVYVSPTSQTWFKELVEKVVKRYKLTCPVIKSDLYNDPVY
jgi:hypothetical protein